MLFKHITYSEESSQFPVAILIKEHLVDSSADKIKQYYTDPLVALGVPLEDIIVIGLPYTNYKDVKAATMNEALPELQEYLDRVGAVHCLVADGKYLKKMVGRTNIQNLAGILLGSRTGSQRLFKGRVYTTYVYDDKAAERVMLSLVALAESYHGTYSEADFMVEEYYPKPNEIEGWLAFLLQQPKITCDVEAFGLRLDDAGIGTIGFCWKEGCAVSFPVDYQVQGVVGKPNWTVRDLLKDFFTKYKGICVYHNVSYDVKQLVANLFMKNNLLDYENMIEGILLLTENHRCTKDITYLATNSAAGNDLSLKHNALPYTGVYAIDVKDITQHPVDTVLEYNGKDCAATWWLYHKMYPIMVSRNQEKLYLETFQPNQRMLINMELTGMPLDMDEVIKLRKLLDESSATLLDRMRSMKAVEEYLEFKAVLAHQKYQDSVKGSGRTLENYKEWKKDELVFKPTSDPALVWILHEYYCLPVIDKTLKAREPSVAGNTLEKHLDWIKAGNGNPEAAGFINDVLEYLTIDKINGTFVKAFITKSIKKGDGVYYLHGSFNQGGCISGRLSSSDP